MDPVTGIRVPEQDLSGFTHFDPQQEAAARWAEQLPVTNIHAVSQQLLAAIEDLNRYPLPTGTRQQVLDALLGHAVITLTNLTRRFLNQPLIMPEKPRQLVAVADKLLQALHTGYSILAIDARDPENVRHTNQSRLLASALHRAIHFLGRRILLAFHLYRPVPLGCWQTLNQLYALAEQRGITDLPDLAEGLEVGPDSVGGAYLQVLMLACCKTNQLRQSDLAAVYDALGQWADHLMIGPEGEMSGLFTVDLERDQPALYSVLYGDAISASRRRIDTLGLVDHLEQLGAQDTTQSRRGVRLDTGATLSQAMLAHMVEALGSMSLRNFKRVEVDAPVLVSLGLSSVHYHAAGERSFDELLREADYAPELPDAAEANPFLRQRNPRADIWSAANPEEDYEREAGGDSSPAASSQNIELDLFTRGTIEAQGTAAAPRSEVSLHRVRQVNSSPGGFCLEWTEGLPEELRTGNIASVREQPHGYWSVAVVRWVSRLENARTLVGLELISPSATAFAALTRQKRGEPRLPQRALLLPEIKLVGQLPSIITPPTGRFHEGLRITLFGNGEKRHLQLRRQLANTASYMQFEFREVQELGDKLSDTAGDNLDAYDSMWSSI